MRTKRGSLRFLFGARVPAGQFGRRTMTISALVSPAATCIFAFSMVRAGLMDLTTYKIRNGLVLLLLLAYATLAPFAGFVGNEIGWSVVVAAGVLLFAVIFFAFG